VPSHFKWPLHTIQELRVQVYFFLTTAQAHEDGTSPGGFNLVAAADDDYTNFTFCEPCIVIYRWKKVKVKGNAIPLQAWTGPEGSRRLRLQDFKTIGT
jgi:hypothetical protein